MTDPALTVYIIDDDAAVRDSLSLLLSLRGYSTASFASAEDFLLRARPDWTGCVMADIRMPGMSGLELQQELGRRDIQMPVVIMTAHGSVAASRVAFKAQAVDFLEKPFDDDGPVQAVEAAFARERMRLAASRSEAARQKVLSSLTDREREVALLLAQGLHHAEVGQQLGISPRTVEVHKARIMSKLGARNVTELVRLTLGAEG
jgi:RNA polymerase sigma factor (sigma-70 family)